LTGKSAATRSSPPGRPTTTRSRLISQPLGTIVRNSGNKFWFEARIELATLGDGGIFVGLTTEANATATSSRTTPRTRRLRA
jgi:hypothetical protein